VERIWVEINKRVNYPIKNALISMENEGLIATECQRDPVDCFCVSWVTLQVAHEGVQLAIAAWNSHSVPGKGVPNQRMLIENYLNPLDPSLVPSVSEAISTYQSMGGRLTLFSNFGQDPLKELRNKCETRLDAFRSRYSDFKPIFHTVCNGDHTLFRGALLFFIDITKRLARSP
jgi:hypothetical protein